MTETETAAQELIESLQRIQRNFDDMILRISHLIQERKDDEAMIEAEADRIVDEEQEKRKHPYC